MARIFFSWNVIIQIVKEINTVQDVIKKVSVMIGFHDCQHIEKNIASRKFTWYIVHIKAVVCQMLCHISSTDVEALIVLGHSIILSFYHSIILSFYHFRLLWHESFCSAECRAGWHIWQPPLQGSCTYIKPSTGLPCARQQPLPQQTWPEYNS